MKNLPEDELFNSIENRLRDYSELPEEETWDNIVGAVSPAAELTWTVWTNRAAAALSLLVLLFLFNGQNNSYKDLASTTPSNTKSGKERADDVTQRTTSQGPKSGESNFVSKQSSPNPVSSPLAYSKNSAHVTGEMNNTSSTELSTMKGDGEKVEAIKETSISSNSTGHLITETPVIDSVVVEVKEIKKDSASSAGIVLPPNKRRKKSKLAFYSMVAPSLSFQHVTPDSEDGVVVDKINSPGVISQERLGFTIETGIQGQISERFQYVFALSYYQQSQQLEYEETTEGAIVESGDDLNYDIKPSTMTRTFDYSMRNVGVHAGLLYTLKKGGLMHKAGVVLQYQLGLMQSGEGAVYDNSSSDYFNYQLLYRVEYQFKSGIGLFVQPSYIHSIISNESLDAPFELKQSRASLGIGILYRF